MPGTNSSSRPGSSGGGGGPIIDKLDYHPGRPLIRPSGDADEGESSGRPSGEHSYAGSFFEQVAEGILERDRKRLRQQTGRYAAFGWAILNWYVVQCSFISIIGEEEEIEKRRTRKDDALLTISSISQPLRRLNRMLFHLRTALPAPTRIHPTPRQRHLHHRRTGHVPACAHLRLPV